MAKCAIVVVVEVWNGWMDGWMDGPHLPNSYHCLVVLFLMAASQHEWRPLCVHHLDFFNYLFLENERTKQNNIFYHFGEIFVYLAYSIIITVSRGLKFVPFLFFLLVVNCNPHCFQ